VANSKVAALEAALAARSVEQVAMRRHLHAARQALDPHIIQARAQLHRCCARSADAHGPPEGYVARCTCCGLSCNI